MSGQLLWSKEGADWSLVTSPANVNVGWPADNAELIPAALAPAVPPAGAGLISIQGTATSFPELRELEEAAVSVEEGEGVVLVVELRFAADEFAEITAKSTLPEAGFKIMSLTVPMVWP